MYEVLIRIKDDDGLKVEKKEKQIKKDKLKDKVEENSKELINTLRE